MYGCLLFLRFQYFLDAKQQEVSTQAGKQTLENTVVFSKFEGKVLYIKKSKHFFRVLVIECTLVASPRASRSL